MSLWTQTPYLAAEGEMGQVFFGVQQRLTASSTKGVARSQKTNSWLQLPVRHREPRQSELAPWAAQMDRGLLQPHYMASGYSRLEK